MLLSYGCQENNQTKNKSTKPITINPYETTLQDTTAQKDDVSEVADTVNQFPKEEEPYVFKIYKSPWLKQLDTNFEYHSARIDSIINAREPKHSTQLDWMSDYYDVLKKNEVNSLSPSELLYYCLAYPSHYYQNCNPFYDGDPNDKNLYLYMTLPSPEGGHGLSNIQSLAITKNKDTISALLIKYLAPLDIIPEECLSFIQSENLHDLIPLLCEKADFKKNKFCSTVLFSFMRYPGYKAFINSSFYKGLKNDGYGRLQVKSSDLQQLTQWAKQFHDSKVK